MSIENLTRTRHEFAKKLRVFLHDLTHLSIEELEISRARVADLVVESEGLPVRDQHIQRGKVLHSVVEAAIRGEFPTKKFGRRALEKRVLEEIATLKGKENYQAAVEEYSRSCEKHTHDLAEWRKQRKALPWYSRILSANQPQTPAPPQPEYLFVQDSVKAFKKISARGELLIDYIASFPLPAPTQAGSGPNEASLDAVLKETQFRT